MSTIRGGDSFERDRDRDADNLGLADRAGHLGADEGHPAQGGRPPGRDSPERIGPNRADEPQTYAPLINLSRASDRRMLY